MNTSNKSQYEYVVGIDFGHGETSAAYCPIQWGTPKKELARPKDIELENNKKAIPSAISFMKNGDVAIGSDAFNEERLKQAKVHVCFKKAPVSDDGEDEQLMISFMREVYLRIKLILKSILSEGNHLVYIATPSGWDEDTKVMYQEMAKKAKIPVGGVTTESRAAILSAKNDAATGLTKIVDKGAIVFDLGSSTLDFTYMRGMEKPTDHGFNHGASEIEKLIYQLNSDKDDIKYFENKYPDLVPALLFKARQVKEAIYNNGSRVKVTVNFEDMIDDEELEDKKCQFKFEQGELNQLLKDKGYMKNLEEDMNNFKHQYINDAPIYGVFLTGGAARMDFVIPLITRTWELQENQIFKDQDPSLSISRGVAEIARADLLTRDAEESLEKDISRLLKEQSIYDLFIGEFITYLYENLRQSIYDNSINSLKENSVSSLGELEKNINWGIEYTLQQANSDAPRIFTKALNEYASSIQPKLQEIISHYSDEKINFKVKNIILEKFDIDFNLQNELSSITESIMSGDKGWLGAMLGAGLGVWAAILFGGPVGWVAGGGTFLGQALFGKSDAERKEEARNKQLSQNDYKKIVSEFEKQKTLIDGRLRDSIINAILQNTAMRDIIIEETQKILTQQVQDCITKARREIK